MPHGVLHHQSRTNFVSSFNECRIEVVRVPFECNRDFNVSAKNRIMASHSFGNSGCIGYCNYVYTFSNWHAAKNYLVKCECRSCLRSHSLYAFSCALLNARYLHVFHFHSTNIRVVFKSIILLVCWINYITTHTIGASSGRSAFEREAYTILFIVILANKNWKTAGKRNERRCCKVNSYFLLLPTSFGYLQSSWRKRKHSNRLGNGNTCIL